MPHYHAYYETYTEEQFTADEYFQQWVLLEDRRNNHFWKSYLDRYPQQFEVVMKARRLVEDLAVNTNEKGPLTSREKRLLKESVYQQLGLQYDNEPPVARRRAKKIFYRLLAAATVAGIAAGAYLFLNTPSKSDTLLVEQTGIKEIKEVTLPDSSVIVLNANSSLKFSSHFLDDSIREIDLEGNAYFKVKKMPGQTPFVVNAGQLRIRVTGTEFNVNARTRATDIVLTSGKVNVTLKDDQQNTAFMKAGERLKLDTLKQQLVSTAVNTELYTTAWMNKEWHFQETTLDSIAELIKEFYGMEMVFADNKQRKLMITAVVSVNDFSVLINVIAKTLNIKIKEERNQLIIY